MRQITYEEFEQFWYEDDGRLGILLFDRVDADWSFVVLEKDDIGVFKAVDCGVSFMVSREARLAMEKAFAHRKDLCLSGLQLLDESHPDGGAVGQS